MGKARKVILETKAFDKAGDATSFFRLMLNKYLRGQTVSDTDALHLTALLKRHDEMAEKIGVGVHHFKVDLAPSSEGPPTQCFWIVRTDATEIDFSFNHCLKARPCDL